MVPSCRLVSKVVSHVVSCTSAVHYRIYRAIKILRRFLSTVIDADEPARNRRSLFNVCLFICPSFIREWECRLTDGENHFPPDYRWQPPLTEINFVRATMVSSKSLLGTYQITIIFSSATPFKIQNNFIFITLLYHTQKFHYFVIRIYIIFIVIHRGKTKGERRGKSILS